MIVNNSLLLIIISSPQIHIDHSLLVKYYQKPIVDHDNQEHIGPKESTLEYNYITTEKFIEQSILKYQDILQ